MHKERPHFTPTPTTDKLEVAMHLATTQEIVWALYRRNARWIASWIASMEADQRKEHTATTQRLIDRYQEMNRRLEYALEVFVPLEVVN